MKKTENWLDLKDFIDGNYQYLLTGKGLDEKKQVFGVEYNRFQEYFISILTQYGMISKDSKIIDQDELDKVLKIKKEEICQKLKKYSGYRVRDMLLVNYHSLCVSLQVLNLFHAFPIFFLGLFDNDKNLLEIFKDNENFHALKDEFSEQIESEIRSIKLEEAKNSAPKEKYHAALKAIVPAQNEAKDFNLLCHFFIEYPLVRNFIHKNIDEFKSLAETFQPEKPNLKRPREEDPHSPERPSDFGLRLVGGSKSPDLPRQKSQPSGLQLS